MCDVFYEQNLRRIKISDLLTYKLMIESITFVFGKSMRSFSINS